ncbi:potassium voltage-gated channel subfamily C member 3a isoform X4, partial [Tachysurus ichikawai]
SKQNGDAANAALANEDCPTIDQVLGPDDRSPATGTGRYPHDRACFLLSAGEFRTTDSNVRKEAAATGTASPLGDDWFKPEVPLLQQDLNANSASSWIKP